jgi:hypothetical protein
MSDETAIVEAQCEIVKTGITALGTPENMRQSLDENSARLSVVHDYISDNFVLNVDYGKTFDQSKKLSLMKPGAEKICKLFNTTPRWRMDRDTWEMVGKPKNAVFYICEIVENSTGNIIGEGRGAGEVGAKSRDMNKTVKNAEKCALVDAALYTFNLSSMFTQDMDGKQSGFKRELSELWDAIKEARTGCESSMKNSEFLKRVTADYLHMDPQTVGDVRALRKAIIDDGVYDLATAERIPI